MTHSEDSADLDDAKEAMPSETLPTSRGPAMQDHETLGDGSSDIPSEVPTGENVEDVADLGDSNETSSLEVQSGLSSEMEDDTQVCDVSEETISEGQVGKSYGDATDNENDFIMSVAVTNCNASSSALVMSKGHMALTDVKYPESFENVIPGQMTIRQQLQSSVSGGESYQIIIEKTFSDSFYSILELYGPQPSSSEVVTLPFCHVPQ